MPQTKRKRKALESLPEKNRNLYNAFMFTEPVDLFDPAAVEQRTRQYIDYVNQNDIAPLWADYAFVLGYSRLYLHDVLRGTSRTHQPMETRQLLERVHLFLEASLSQYGIQHPEAAVMTIWLQKNCFSYRDSPMELQVNNNSLIAERPRTLEEIQRRNAFILASVPQELEHEPDE